MTQHEKDLEDNQKRKIEGFFDFDEQENVVKSYRYQKLKKVKSTARTVIEYNKTANTPEIDKPVKYSLESGPHKNGTVKLVPDRKVTQEEND